MLKRSLIIIFLLVAALLICAQRTARAQSSTGSSSGSETASKECRKYLAESKEAENGIFVGDPKVYDDRSLQTLLSNLRGRLAQISGLDQNTLVGRVGSLQGASARQLGFSMQGSGMPLPGSTTKSSQSGLETQVTSPAVTPTSPALPTAPSFSPSSTFSQSALNTLNEQMQLNYEIINLQMLLEGSLNDQYMRGTNARKRHVTLGFPISITAPSKDYKDAVAEVEITVCNLSGEDSIEPPLEPPSLMTVLPREKTYNVATVSNKLSSLGASAVVADVFSLGATFLWGHSTYYIVQDQDTIAIQRSESSGCVTFVWQFRPVLGEKAVRQGLRQTFAQISFPPRISGKKVQMVERELEEPINIGKVKVATKWRKYDRKTGIVGAEIAKAKLAGSPVSSHNSCIANFDKSPPDPAIKTMDNYDGTTTVTARSNYKSRTRVRVGSLFLDESAPGFQHTPEYIRFTVPNQLLALNDAKIVSPSGLEISLDYWWPGVSEKMTDKETYLTVVGVNLVEVFVPKASLEVPPGEWSKEVIEGVLKGNGGEGPFPLIVTIGSKAFGLGDAPFKSETEDYISFLVSKDFIRNQRTLTVKRLLLGEQFMHPYKIPDLFDVSGVTVLSTNANGGYTGFALLGTGLDESIKIVYPEGVELKRQDKSLARGNMLFFRLSKEQLSGLKQLVVQRGDDPPILVAIPDSKPSEKKTTLSDHDPIEVATGVAYKISGPKAESIDAIQYLDKKLPFTLSLNKESITLKLPDDMTGSPGIRWLSIIYSDKSTERYKVEVINPKAKQP
jgi:hypothetical protein